MPESDRNVVRNREKGRILKHLDCPTSDNVVYGEERVLPE